MKTRRKLPDIPTGESLQTLLLKRPDVLGSLHCDGGISSSYPWLNLQVYLLFSDSQIMAYLKQVSLALPVLRIPCGIYTTRPDEGGRKTEFIHGIFSSVDTFIINTVLRASHS